MAHAQKPDFIFRRNGRVHLNRRGPSVQSTTGSRGVRISGSNAGYSMFRGSVKGTGYPLHSPVHLNRRGRQFSRLLAAEVCASAVVMLDTACSEVVWRVLAAHSIRQFPLHFPSRASLCALTFQLEPMLVCSNVCLHTFWHVDSHHAIQGRYPQYPFWINNKMKHLSAQ